MKRIFAIIFVLIAATSNQIYAAEGQGEIEVSILKSKNSDLDSIARLCFENLDTIECLNLKDSVRYKVKNNNKEYTETYEILTLNLR